VFLQAAGFVRLTLTVDECLLFTAHKADGRSCER
jgi:hypothetical protein